MLNNPINSDICGDNGLWYPTEMEYCIAFVENSVNIKTCPGCDSHLCCKNHCIEDHGPSYMVQCNSEWVIYPLVDDFCQAYCEAQQAAQDSDDSTLAYQPAYCNTVQVLCTEFQCCHAKCMLDHEAKCIANTYAFISRKDYCDYECNHLSGTVYHECEGDCTQGKCDSLKCQHQMISYSYNFQPVCGTNHQWYMTQKDFCDAGNTGVSDYTLCNVIEVCSTNYQCCKELCHQEFSSDMPLCFKSGGLYHDIDEFCSDFCPNWDESNILTIPTTQYAHEEACCKHFCNARDNKSVCRMDFTLMTSETELCDLECNGNQGQKYYPCDGVNCTPNDCLIKKCLYELEHVDDYQAYTICGDNTVLYYSLYEYCKAKALS